MFPASFPQQALQAALKPVLHGGALDGLAVLGLYDILGFGLYQAFGPVTYPLMTANETPEHLANVMAQAPGEVQKFAEFMTANPELMTSKALPIWLIPMAKQIAEYLLNKLFERLGSQENPTVFGLKLKMSPPHLEPIVSGLTLKQ